jgi:hypothetical protein
MQACTASSARQSATCWSSTSPNVKVALGTCGRDHGTPCAHENACVRCSLLRPNPAQRARLEEIRDNLEARIVEATREGWLGEVEGLHVSLAGARDKLTQIDAALQRQATTTQLGMPSFTHVAGRAPTTSQERPSSGLPAETAPVT